MTNRLTRRELLRRGAIGGAALSFPSLLAACGGDEGDGIAGQQETEAETQTQPTDTTLAQRLVFANWPLYIDTEGKRHPTLEKFEKELDVNVRYIEEINDNNEYFAKIQPSLSQGEPIGRDIIVLTDWMAGRLIRLGWLEKLNKDAIPNFENLQDTLASPNFDPNREYSLPWQSGMTGIAYNRKLVGGTVDSIEQLLTDPKLKGKVTILSEMGDTVGLTMLANGDDPSDVTEEGFQNAIDTLQQAVDSGQIRQVTGNDYASPLSKGDVLASMAWSGDVVQLQLDNPNLEFVLPQTGGMIWSDNMLIPLGGDVFTASTYMNYVYRPEVQAEIEAWVNYIPPVEGTREAMQDIDPSLTKNTLIFPTDEMREQLHIFDSEAYENEDFRRTFQTLLGA